MSEGDARDLPAGDSSYDAVLLLGPLYHLPERVDRLRALAEARRVVKHDGPVVVAAISRSASLLDCLRTGALSDPVVRLYIERTLETGRNTNPSGRPEYFTTAYFHHPDELQDEMSKAGLRFEVVLGVEGPGWLMWERWDDPEGQANILRVASGHRAGTVAHGRERTSARGRPPVESFISSLRAVGTPSRLAPRARAKVCIPQHASR